MNPNSQKAKLIARLQTYVPLYDWPLLDELAESGGPSEREAAIDECRDAAHDAIHHAIERIDLCAFVKGHVDEALLALKNAAPQQSKGGTGRDPGPIAAGAAPQQSAGADGGWISVKDRLPEPDTKVLIWWFWSKSRCGFGEFSSQGYWRPEGSNGNFNDCVTHWMPLPAAPSNERNER